MKITILTLFPEMFTNVFGTSMIWHAQDIGAVEIELINFRDFSTSKHKKVDDASFGGGPGMLLSVEPIFRALQSIQGLETAHKILLTPQGEPYVQDTAKRLAKMDHLILICGHYEGFDERVRTLVDQEISIGDYVLTGGEIGAMAIVDSVSRLLPGVLTSDESFEQDSFYNGLLEYPQYTRPRSFMGMDVPEVLISGNHQEVEKWRREQALKRTQERRPDLLKNADKKD
ncbi:MAG TPA: tRNA (guanosine(37)-N1)-methyltransferase TrmD [Candidatus Izemoplasmatales bacterium]|nr:tRNA (guanosine(37)-N1)-methyltransferase TrmD [Bacillota bacterium]HRY78027.1 tRNA (guanosine(37)-N1)-methyltransferase TrmD [Candidatus Izemoplasmatales bacterium]